jgi:hypothetical protein
VDEMDAALEQNPHDCGESREHDRRVMLVRPVGILFTIVENQRQVRVETVRQY